MNPQKVALSLFWRTFFLLLLLLSGGLLTWTMVLTLLDRSPSDLQAGRELATIIRIAREAVRHSSSEARAPMLRAMVRATGVQLQPHAASDRWKPLPEGTSGLSALLHDRLPETLRAELGPATLVASAVNGQGGLWIGFQIDREPWWLRASPALEPRALDSDWLLAMAGVLLATLLASVLIARRINKPLRELSFAASRIREGDLDSRLDETTITSEIREVNMGFNRMARELAKVEEDRAVMLAGISHDLRTPLARLRLETEMSVADDEARSNMADDIDQLDAIIDKFMDYARPGETHLRPVLLSRLIDKEAGMFRDPNEIRIISKVAIDLQVMADEVELGRVFANLFENARRYGRNVETGQTNVHVSYVRTGNWVICTVRDEGPGVAREKLSQLTTPFFRGDAARTAATGAGLGLAIVEKAMQRMGGQVELANGASGGLIVHLRMRYAR